MSEQRTKSGELAFDIAKQLLTIAFGGMAFAIGVTGENPTAFEMWEFWAAIVSLGGSAACGFLLLMNAVATLARGECYDVYGRKPRTLMLVQIAGVCIGAVLLLMIHGSTTMAVKNWKNESERSALERSYSERQQRGHILQ